MEHWDTARATVTRITNPTAILPAAPTTAGQNAAQQAFYQPSAFGQEKRSAEIMAWRDAQDKEAGPGIGYLIGFC